MDAPLEPRMASAALEEIALRRRQVVDAATTFPGWYWPIIGLAMVGLAVVVDTRDAVAIGIAAACFVLAVLADTASVVVPRYRRAQWNQELLGAPEPLPSWRSSGWWWAARSHWRSPCRPLGSRIRRRSDAPWEPSA